MARIEVTKAKFYATIGNQDAVVSSQYDPTTRVFTSKWELRNSRRVLGYAVSGTFTKDTYYLEA